MVSLKNKLNRLKPYMSNDSTTSMMSDEKQKPIEKKKQKPIEKKGNIPFLTEWETFGVSPFYVGEEYCLVREVKYPLEMQYGKYRLSEFIDAIEAWNNTSYTHPLSAKGFRPDQLFFFDTETTGLGGGTGNTIFLLGHASLMEDHIVLKQHILPHPGAEVPLYTSFLESVDYENLVTYNGKAFDWPQVKTRHTLIRDHVPKLPSFGHFDLFHAARRLWKHKLERLKLSIVEKEVLDIKRVDDVPGFLAPMIYFDFVERKDPEGMMGMLKHNEMDILSLITLYTHLTFQLLSLDDNQTVKEKYEVGRWYAYIKESKAAKETFSQISNGQEMDAVRAKFELAMQFKRSGDLEQAIELWENISQLQCPLSAFHSCIELAKVFEHKKRDVLSAIEFTEKAISLLANHNLSIKTDEVEKRMIRLKRRLGTSQSL
ncbi:ribonuclease H-like domain-containing protein [Bacillus sp. 31A1R]|uniref:Ribonuclease H-like domain-containing protein n=1 Tax=Robertmurraya mangrovi TaxID=3098077 RepID=A0ABU5J1B7_9BACI|nr:ribonuclease H-like domain-containing protein [Bacillus sp. 31A1R]MDZ5473208.1 ribonuclease H-like domain-containing protein [Bacillus sp. 31A1R]